MSRFLWLCVLLVVVMPASPQAPGTGFPPFSSVQGGGFDAVNLQSLNFGFVVPVVSHPGRGLTFHYGLAYNSLVYIPATNGSTTSWAFPDGWSTQGPIGSVSNQTTVLQLGSCEEIMKNHYTYVDPTGTPHLFPLEINSGCGNMPSITSGYALDASGYFMGPGVIAPDGTAINFATTSAFDAYGNLITQNPTITDANGNSITSVTCYPSSQTNPCTPETDWKDTLGQTALKITSQGNGPNGQTSEVDYARLAVDGTYQTVAMKYEFVSVKSNFGCSGVTEYTSSSQRLVSEIDLPNGQKYSFAYEPTPGSSGYVTGRIQQITLPTGGTITYGYPGPNSGINCADGSMLSLTRTISDGSTSSAWTYSRVPNNKGGTTTVTAPQLPYDQAGNQTVITFDPTLSFETTRQIYQGTAGTPLRTVITAYTNNSSGSNNTPTSQTTILEDGSTQSEVETSYDSNGNLLSSKEHDWGHGAPGSVLRTTTIQYLATSQYTALNIINKVLHQTVADASGAIKSRTDITYDGSGFVNAKCPTGAAQHDDANFGCSFGTRGLPTSVTTYTDAATPAGGVTKNFSYDSLGNLISAQVNCCQQKQWSFSSTTQYAFPDSVTSGTAGGTQLSTSFTYNLTTGQIATATDENLEKTTYTYNDPGHMDRLTDVKRPDSTHLTSAFNDVQNTITSTAPVQGTNVVQQITALDALGRPLTGTIEDASNNIFSITKTQYDALGRPYMSSNPYTTSPQFWTTHQFDALGRPTVTILPDGSQSGASYANNSVTAIDPTSWRRSFTDGLGRLIEVDEPSSSSLGTDPTASVTISGSVQVAAIPGTAGRSLPANWTINTGTFAVGPNGFSGTSSNTQRAVAFYNGSFSNDQFAQMTMTVVPSNSDGLGPAVRVQPGGGVMGGTYYGFFVAESNNTAYMFKAINGAGSVIVQATGQSVNPGDVLRLEVQGTSLTAKINGIVILTATDSAITSGNPGIHTEPNNAVSQAATDFAGGNLPQGAESISPFSSSLSSNWTDNTGAFTIGPSGVSGTSANTQRAVAFYNGVFSNDQFAQLTMTVVPSNSDGLGPAVRVQPGGGVSGGTYYGFFVAEGDNTAYLFRSISGASSIIAQDTGESVNPGDVLRLEVQGTTLTAKINGTVIFTATDSAITSGNPGIHTEPNNAVSQAANNFVAGNLPQGTQSSDPLASNWTVNTGTFGVGPNGISGTSPNTQRAVAFYNGAFSNDQFAQLTMTVVPSNSDGLGPAVRVQPGGGVAGGTYYGFYVVGSNTAYLLKAINGSLSVVAQATAQSVNPGDVLRLEVQGTSLTAKINGTVILTATDSAITSGNPGIHTEPNNAVSQAATDFAGGNLGQGDDFVTVSDAGFVSLSIESFTANACFGPNTDPACAGKPTNNSAVQVAAALVAALNVPGSPVSATASGTTINLTWLNAGPFKPIVNGLTTVHENPSVFSAPSFTSAEATFSGGQPGSNPAVTTYTYGLYDNLLQVTSGVQTRSYGYDGMGRLTDVTTPEAGHVNYQYNSFDLLTQRTDARNVQTSFQYDTLNRLIGVGYTIPQGSSVAATPNACTPSGGVPANVCYAYGTSTSSNNNGRLLSVVDPTGSETYSYDLLGRVSQLQKVINGTAYNIGYSYNLASELTQITYPSGRNVQQSFDTIGRLCEIAPQTSGCGSATAPFATAYGYNSSGQMIGFNYGNGIAAGFGYSADRMQLTGISYTKGAQTVFGANYFYHYDAANCPTGTAGNNGQIQCIADIADSGRSAAYTYDPLGRLLTAGTKGSTAYPAWGLSWSYDQYGNRLAQNVTAGSASPNSTPTDPTTNRINNGLYSYDAGGNMTYDGNNTLVYDAASRLASSTQSSVTSTYSYDCKSLRVVKSSNGTTTVYVYSGTKVIAEYQNGAAVISPTREYIYSGSGLLAKIEGGVTNYYQADRLSTRVTTDASGNIIGQQGLYPFGDPWYDSGTTSKKKLGDYERDLESGNDYALARYDVNRIGRFASPDPLGGSVLNPQSMNRYSYVANDPINLGDPSGMFITAMDRFLDPAGFGSNGYFGANWGEFAFFSDPVQIGTAPLYHDDNPDFPFEGFSSEQLANRAADGDGPTLLGQVAVYGYVLFTTGGPGTGDLSKAINSVIRRLISNPDCANLFGGLGKALGAVFNSTFQNYSPGMDLPPGVPADELAKAMKTNNATTAFPDSGPPQGHTYVAASFYDYPVDGVNANNQLAPQLTQTNMIFHELEHTVTQQDDPHLGTDTYQGAMNDLQKFQTNCQFKPISVGP